MQALPFPDGTFDVCCAARLLEHLSDAERALTEMVRVSRLGGRIVVFDFDWDTLIIDHPDKETTRTIVLSYSDSIRNGWIGRQLPRLFKEQHLEMLSIATRRRARDVADQLYDLHHCRRQKVILEDVRLTHSVMLLFALLPSRLILGNRASGTAPVRYPLHRTGGSDL